MDDSMLEIINIDAYVMAAFTDIRRMTVSDTFNMAEITLQTAVRTRLRNMCDKLSALSSATVFRNAGNLIDLMIKCLQSLAEVIRLIRIGYPERYIRNNTEALISSHRDEFIHLESNLKQICEMHAIHATNTKTMEQVVDLLNIIVSKLEIKTDYDENPVPNGPADRV
jgi:hypothetical protein